MTLRELPGGQQGDLWHEHRLGRVTASRMKDLMAYSKQEKKRDAQFKAREDYMWELLAERTTRREQNNRPPTPAMQWGIDNEPFALQLFEKSSDVFIIPVGFVLHPRFNFAGASPDGLTDDTIIEVKCPESTTYLKWKLTPGVPDEHKDQMYWQMACTGRQKGIFIGFDPRQPEGQRIFFRDLPRDDSRIAQLEAEAIKIDGEVEAKIAELGLPPTQWLIEDGELTAALEPKSKLNRELKESLQQWPADLTSAEYDFIDAGMPLVP